MILFIFIDCNVKLRQTIELLELNEDVILNFLVDEISINNIRPLIKQKLKEKLHENDFTDLQQNLYEQSLQSAKTILAHDMILPDKIEVYKPIENNIVNILVESVEEKNNEIVELGISEVQNYLKKYV